MHNRATLVVAVCFALLPIAAVAGEVIGWIEYVRLFDQNTSLIMKAKIDTGARTTSVHNKDHEIFEKDGGEWVRFTLTNHDGKSLSFEKPVVRYVKIKRHFTESQTRPVIMLGLCLGSTYAMAEVNLVDRSRFEYPLLVGRQFLENGLLVDSSSKHINNPHCSVSKTKQ
jgi:hypothetical protein